MNVVSKSVDRFALEIEPHPHPFKVALVDKIFFPVKERCLITLKIGPYSGDMYCEVLIMNVDHLLLGRPWLYDNAMKHCGRNNTLNSHMIRRPFF